MLYKKTTLELQLNPYLILFLLPTCSMTLDKSLYLSRSLSFSTKLMGLQLKCVLGNLMASLKLFQDKEEASCTVTRVDDNLLKKAAIISHLNALLTNQLYLPFKHAQLSGQFEHPCFMEMNSFFKPQTLSCQAELLRLFKTSNSGHFFPPMIDWWQLKIKLEGVPQL